MMHCDWKIKDPRHVDESIDFNWRWKVLWLVFSLLISLQLTEFTTEPTDEFWRFADYHKASQTGILYFLSSALIFSKYLYIGIYLNKEVFCSYYHKSSHTMWWREVISILNEVIGDKICFTRLKVRLHDRNRISNLENFHNSEWTSLHRDHFAYINMQ